MIISFYSYKGGVGRTQLCANIAAYLCYKKGKRVLLWDWDFEAPGLHFFFDKINKDINKNGTLELLENYVSLMRSKSGIEKEDLTFVTKDNIVELSKLKTINYDTEKPVTACIDLLPPGNLSSNFSSRINDFNWFEFYELLDGINYMQLLKEEIKKLPYDYIFIDSRTGISDYSGICNIQLPDMNVFLMAANKQNFNGCSRIADQIINSEYIKKGFRDPVIMPLLSRVDTSHPELYYWTTDFADRFGKLMEHLDADLEKEFYEEVFADVYLQETFLEYVPAISAGENLFFTKEDQKFSKLSFEQKFINIAIFIQKFKKKGSISIDDSIDKDTWIDYAKTAVISKNDKKAAIAYQHAGETDKSIEYGGTATSWYYKGNDYYIKGDKDKAIECYKEVIVIEPDYNVWFNMGLAYDDKQEYDNAIIAYQKAVDIEPDDHEAWNNMGTVYGKKNMNDKAIKAFQRTVDIKPDYHYAWNNMGISYDKKGEYDNAMKTYQKAVDIKPDYHEAWNNIGITYDKRGEPDNAIKAYQKAVDIKPDYSEPWTNMGIIYDKKGEFDNAMKAYQKAVDIKPDYPEPWNNIGIIYDKKGEFDNAMKAYQKAVDIKPDYPEPWNNMGVAYNKEGKYDGAIEFYQKATSIKPNYYEAWNNIGIAYDNKDESDNAKSAYQKAIAIKPDYKGAYINLGFLYIKLGNLELAEINTVKSIELGSLDYGNMNLGHIYLAKVQKNKAIENYKLSIKNYKDKNEFFKGYDDDYQYLKQYNISKKEYEEIKKELLE